MLEIVSRLSESLPDSLLFFSHWAEQKERQEKSLIYHRGAKRRRRREREREREREKKKKKRRPWTEKEKKKKKATGGTEGAKVAIWLLQFWSSSSPCLLRLLLPTDMNAIPRTILLHYGGVNFVSCELRQNAASLRIERERTHITKRNSMRKRERNVE